MARSFDSEPSFYELIDFKKGKDYLPVISFFITWSVQVYFR